ncbi:phosphodiester glycosidase family protein [Enterovirga sp.]|uniref:phosphodiester glycosidase family protein n=1 Tax=Enterovirga sp. TaxID=2026350 RepID=UPI002B669012|nr:phosphodiester glycosidase family protein [Enterovirga sp.]HMO30730.1 phosphodiester glycosidase family protein [Enterovirga sp.]
MRRAVLVLLSALIGALAAPAIRAAPHGGSSGCREVTFEEARYTVCRIDMRTHELRLFLRGPDGSPFGSLSRFLGSPMGRGVAMAMNAGMYHEDLSPVGLYVEDGRELKHLNRARGPGNFHMKPNGVFFVAGGRAGVLETDAFARRRPKATLATQSGPMLVIDGKLHPRFSDEGPSRKYRNGVGVSDGSAAIFAISDEPVSFGAFARLFRDALGCRNALFLDGSVSSLHAADLGRTDISLKPIGPIIAALRR